MQNKTAGIIILFILSFIFYGNSISNDYALDDLIVITGNEFTQKGFDGLKEIFTHDAFVGAYGKALDLSGGRYRPLSIASFAVEKDVFGYKPEVFHFFSVLFYALTSVMIFVFLIRLFSSRKDAGKNNFTLPFLSALLFLILPIHTEVVANIKSRDEIFALLFCIVSFYLLLPRSTILKKNKSGEKSGTKTETKKTYNAGVMRITFSTIIFFLALLSKENAITFLLLIPLGLIMFTDMSFKNILIRTAPLAVVSVIYVIMRADFAGIIGDRTTTDIMDDPYLFATTMEKLATISQIQLRYLLLIIFPHQLSFDYSYNQIPLTGWSDPMAIASLLLHIAAFVYAIKNFNRNRIVSYFIIYYFITFSIVSNIVFNIGTSMAERFTYMPSLGVTVVIAYGLMKLFKMNFSGKPVLKPMPVVIVIVIVFTTGVKTTARNKDWKENYTLYKADYGKVPNSARARLYYGIECIGKYKETNNMSYMEEAITEMKKSAVINPKFHYAYINLGYAYALINNVPESIENYEKVLKLHPENEQALVGLGFGYGKGLNQPDRAIPYYKKVLEELKSTKDEVYEGLAMCYAVQGKYDEAIRYFKEGIRKNPTSAKLYFNAAITYGNKGMKDSSDFYFAKAFELDPELR